MDVIESRSVRSECLFCRIADGEVPAEIVLSNEAAIAFQDIAPTAPTHVVVIPRDHYSNAEELALQSPLLLSEMVKVAAEVATLAGLAGYRLVFNTGTVAGQSVFHAHLHLLGGRPLQWPAG